MNHIFKASQEEISFRIIFHSDYSPAVQVTEASMMPDFSPVGLSICAPTGAGLDELRSAIVAASPTASLHGDTVLVTNARHRLPKLHHS